MLASAVLPTAPTSNSSQINFTSAAPEPADSPAAGTTAPLNTPTVIVVASTSPSTLAPTTSKVSITTAQMSSASVSESAASKTTEVPAQPALDATPPPPPPSSTAKPPASPTPAPAPKASPATSAATTKTGAATTKSASHSTSLLVDPSAPKQSLHVPVITTAIDTRIQTFTPSTVISLTVTDDGRTVVTAPSSFTTTLPYTVGGATTLMPAIIQNPIPSTGALSNNNAVTKQTFLSNKALSGGVFAVIGVVLVSTLTFVIVYTRRKKYARQRAYTQAIYTNAMTQRHSMFEPSLPSFEGIPRPPPIPPRRRPVPTYQAESGGSASPPLTLGTIVHIPNEFSGGFYSTHYSPSENVRNPFQDPSPISGFSELPLLNRPLRNTSSAEGHDNNASSNHSGSSRPPSPTPSTPSLYPPTLPALDDTFIFGSTPRPSLQESRPSIPFDASSSPRAI